MQERWLSLRERASLGTPHGYFLRDIYNLGDEVQAKEVEGFRADSQKFQVVVLMANCVAVYEANEMQWLADFLGTSFSR